MSGGHFDYNCFRISEFAEELQREIETNNDKSLDEYGDERGHNFSEDVMSRLIKAQKIIEMAGKLAKEIEWLYSSDIGEDSFKKFVDKILGKG